MTSDISIWAITALLPLMAVLLVLQTNPYQALVIRGILGAIAALVYAMFGAADVALTEALVGTMLSITLYAIAVRSSMTLRVGLIAASNSELPDAFTPAESQPELQPELQREKQLELQPRSSATCSTPINPIFEAIEQALHKHHVRVETLSYANQAALDTALQKQEIHLAYEASLPINQVNTLNETSHHTTQPEEKMGGVKIAETTDQATALLRVRTQHLYDILRLNMPANVRLSLAQAHSGSEQNH